MNIRELPTDTESLVMNSGFFDLPTEVGDYENWYESLEKSMLDNDVTVPDDIKTLQQLVVFMAENHDWGKGKGSYSIVV